MHHQVMSMTSSDRVLASCLGTKHYMGHINIVCFVYTTASDAGTLVSLVLVLPGMVTSHDTLAITMRLPSNGDWVMFLIDVDKNSSRTLQREQCTEQTHETDLE